MEQELNVKESVLWNCLSGITKESAVEYMLGTWGIVIVFYTHIRFKMIHSTNSTIIEKFRNKCRTFQISDYHKPSSLNPLKLDVRMVTLKESPVIENIGGINDENLTMPSNTNMNCNCST